MSEQDHVASLLAQIRLRNEQDTEDAALDAYEFATLPFKVVVRILTAELRPVPGAVMVCGAEDLDALERAVAAAKRATWEMYHGESGWRLEVIVLNRNFDKLPRGSNRLISDIAPRP